MEDNMKMTAERSLEIITEQIAQSRRAVSKSTGQSLYLSGLCTMGMAVLVALVNLVFQTTLGPLLWLLLPIIIWVMLRNQNKNREHAPVSLVGSLVGKTWSTFAYFVISYFVISLIWSFLAARFYTPSEYVAMRIAIAPTITLLMGMAVAITGHILKQRWLVVFGIVAGLGGFLWEHFHVGSWLLMQLTCFSPSELAIPFSTLPCLSVFLFAFIGLVLPSLMLKKQSL